MQANSDLANLLSIDYLIANNIYDAVQDGLVCRQLLILRQKAKQRFVLTAMLFSQC